MFQWKIVAIWQKTIENIDWMQYLKWNLYSYLCDKIARMICVAFSPVHSQPSKINEWLKCFTFLIHLRPQWLHLFLLFISLQFNHFSYSSHWYSLETKWFSLQSIAIINGYYQFSIHFSTIYVSCVSIHAE